MAQIDREVALGKLNSLCHKALFDAVAFCTIRGNRYVELVHFIHTILQLQDSDLHRIINAYGLDMSKVSSEIVAALDRLPRGATSISGVSPTIDEALQEGVLYSALRYNQPQVRSGFILLGLLTAKGLRQELTGISKEFGKLTPETVADQLGKVIEGSPEDNLSAVDGSSVATASGPDSTRPGEPSKGDALKKFCVDYTEQARSGKMDPIVGRDEEIRQCIDILMRRRQNNPILTGEAGVGKTAVVEGFAQRLVAGDVPPQFKDVRLLALDLGLLQAGASMKGEFENRLRQVIDEVQGSAKPIILFIDEAHTLIGAGGAAGQNDAANLLKPALARGTLRTIAATTQAEFKKYFEKDPALTRRFQVVKVDEPDERKALLMIRGLANVLERHFKVMVLDEALESAVRLSKRYIHGRQLPDKAVSLIDTACARVAVSHHAVPAEIDDARRAIEGMNTEIAILDRESAVGSDHVERRAVAAKDLEAIKTRLRGLEEHFAKEKALVDKILELRAKLRTDAVLAEAKSAAPAKDQTKEPVGTATPQPAKEAPKDPSSTPPVPARQRLTDAERNAALESLKKLQVELAASQGETPLILPSVDAQAVAAVIADWTGIPVGRMMKDEIEGVLKLADSLEKRVIGQRHGLEQIASRIQLSRARLDNPTRPVGVFMLVGPSGVGKTETAVALAETLYGGPQALITINMSEYQEPHKVATLMGSPPGYVGYGQGGVLTEAVRRRPYSVLLLDEVEKAHADVHEVFFQVFDKGMMKDSEGVEIDFRNTIILLTSNAGTDTIMSLCADPALRPDPDALGQALRAPLLKVFPPALLGRMNVIPYYPISDEMMRAIIGLQLSRIGKRVQEGHKVPFSYVPEVVQTVASRVTEFDSGARAIDAIITRQMLPRIGKEILERMVAGQPIKRVHIDVKDGEFVYAFA